MINLIFGKIKIFLQIYFKINNIKYKDQVLNPRIISENL